MKKWLKFGIPIAAVVVLVAWYAFRPERLVVNRRVNEAMPTAQGDCQHRLLFQDTFTAFCIQRKVPPRSTAWEMALVFFA